MAKKEAVEKVVFRHDLSFSIAKLNKVHECTVQNCVGSSRVFESISI